MKYWLFTAGVFLTGWQFSSHGQPPSDIGVPPGQSSKRPPFSFEYKGEEEKREWIWDGNLRAWRTVRGSFPAKKVKIRVGNEWKWVYEAPIRRPVVGEKVRQPQRYVLVFNETPETITVHLQYFTSVPSVSGTAWGWLPIDPAKGTEAVTDTFAPGQVGYVATGTTRLRANRVRIWAASQTGKRWVPHQHKDLWLVDEVDKDGYSYYRAPRTESFPFVFELAGGELIGKKLPGWEGIE